MNEKELLKELRRGKHSAFTVVFDSYYRDLLLFAGNYIGERGVCEDIVQSLFLKLWNDRDLIQIEISLRSFLLRSVRNACLDELKHRQVVREHQSYVEGISDLDALDVDNYIFYSDLKQKLDQTLQTLPEEYAIAFKMNRFEGLKYREIAEQLSVSERTVEVRIGKALSVLRERLKEYLILLITFMPL